MFIVPISKLPTISSIDQLSPVQPPEQKGASIPFADVLEEAMQATLETKAQSEIDAYNLAMGNMDDLHTMQINSAKAATAMDFTVELTSRAVSAYNEIMRMQV